MNEVIQDLLDYKPRTPAVFLEVMLFGGLLALFLATMLFWYPILLYYHHRGES